MQQWTTVAVAVLGVMMALMVWPVQKGYAEASQEGATQECDAYIVAHTRSAARKLGRAINRGEYGFQSIDLGNRFVVSAEALGSDEPVEFEVFLEKMGEVAVVVDRRRHWEQTYVIAQAAIGPIVISKTWEPRDERPRGSDCRPFSSAVERPAHPASSVDVEPFRYWGLRAGWRIPSPEMIEASNQAIEDALKETIVEFALKNDDG